MSPNAKTSTIAAALAALTLAVASCRDGAATNAAQPAASTTSQPPSSSTAREANAPKPAAQSPSTASTSNAPSSGSSPGGTSSSITSPSGASVSAAAPGATPPSATSPSKDTPAASQSSTAPQSAHVVEFGYELVRSMPHDKRAFTQGFVMDGGFFYESDGGYGTSSLRRIVPLAGQSLNKIDLPQSIFAEGLTMLDGKLYMITWKTEKGFIYDPTTLKQVGEFAYAGEGWGLTNDGKSLVLSDGTNRIRFIDPKTFAVTRTIDVTLDGKPLAQLNELEWVKGEIYANVWHENFIVRIDPGSGRVTGKVDLTGIMTPAPNADIEDVLNGIAYDAASDRLFVTGKRWTRVYEIKLVKK